MKPAEIAHLQRLLHTSLEPILPIRREELKGLLEIADAAFPFAKDGGVTLTNLGFERDAARLKAAFSDELKAGRNP